ncbi:MAG: transporter substrate-binding domain-containing protein [Clostridia bacterium]|nr:transporter substrate-binding domain-containing protein [Clostridia bacterium]
MAFKRFQRLFLCLFLLCASLAVMPDGSAAAPDDGKEITSIDDLAGCDVAVQTGMICDVLTQQRVPDARIQYYNSQTDALIALQTGKAAAWCCDEPVARYVMLTNPGLVILDEQLIESNLAAVFPKTEAGQKLRDQYIAFVDQLWADGTMKQIRFHPELLFRNETTPSVKRYPPERTRFISAEPPLREFASSRMLRRQITLLIRARKPSLTGTIPKEPSHSVKATS